MRIFLTVMAATMVLSAPMAFAQTDPAATTPAPAPAATTPADPSATSPATPDATTTTQDQTATDADHQVICRTTHTAIESRLRRNNQRICGTRQQWETMQDQNSSDMRQMGRVQGRTS